MNIGIQLFTLLTIVILTSCNNNQNNDKKVISDGTTTMKEFTTIQSDNISNKSIPKQDIGKEKRELKTCIGVIMEILTTSPVYRKKTKGLYDAVVKNGGTSFGVTIEGSPNPKTDDALDYSATYDFSIHETYSDHMPVIARFTFNPTEKLLYEYDVAEDKLNPIEFNRNLLVLLHEVCK